MTRARKLTLSVKEFSHLVGQSLDMAHTAPSSQSFIDPTAVVSETPQKPRPRPSSFQRIFSRPTPGQHEDSSEGAPEESSDTPRKMIAWPFSRSPRKNRPIRDEDTCIDPGVHHSMFPYSVTSPAAGSTSSLGSLIPAHERLFQVTPQDTDEPGRGCNAFTVAASSSRAVDPLHAGDSPTEWGQGAPMTTLDAIFGNGSTTSVPAGSDQSPPSSNPSQSRSSFEGTEANSEPESVDEDPTPRASTFGPRAVVAPAKLQGDPAVSQRRRSQRLSLVVPSRNVDVFALRPAVGAAPHAPSETESSTSVCSTSSLTSPVSRSSSPTIPTTRPSGAGIPSPCVPPSTPPNSRLAAALPDTSNLDFIPTLGFPPRQRKRAMSRSMTPPPSPRPPPTGPLPAVPLSVPPVPPLPPLLHKISMNMTPHSVITSPPRPTIVGAQTNPATALPPSPPGGLRLPSRLSWVSGVRAVLPSPPASPTKSLKSLASKPPPPISPSKAEKKRPHELKRPTSIGVIEAADNVQVRRTKSILLLGSRSKSNVSLGTKRVQIHADVNLDAGESRKPRRKSSAATVGHPIYSFDCAPLITPMPSAELLVPRERRHSAPLFSRTGPRAPGISADWTLSLPFCTDVPGNKIPLSPLSTPQLKPDHGLEEVQGEDWTLCMPLKVLVDTPTLDTAEERDSECTLAETPEGTEAPMIMQLPTPSPSPTQPAPSSIVRSLDPEESTPVDRPASPASLGPHVGGLDLAGGCGKRASGWHVYGWFDEVNVLKDACPVATNSKLVKNHVRAFQKMHDASGRHPSQDSMSTVSTSETTFYSARSSLLVH